jgi:prepilin-type N-terminal cleavage/methylation domain-containing protein
MKKQGFTLTELLAVVVLLGILSLMVVPNAIKMFNQSRVKAMESQEQKVVDAANLYVQDRCTRKIDHSLECPNSYKYGINDQKYVCLSDVQADKYIKDVKFNNTSCTGVIIYEPNENGRYNIGKAYLFCGTGYSTDSTLDKTTYSQCSL